MQTDLSPIHCGQWINDFFSRPYYTGSAEDPVLRLERDHNGGRNKSTKPGIPWRPCWEKWYSTRAEAMAMERAIKARKSRIHIESLIAGKG